jgi:hypothetical protein
LKSISAISFKNIKFLKPDKFSKVESFLQHPALENEVYQFNYTIDSKQLGENITVYISNKNTNTVLHPTISKKEIVTRYF